MTQGPAVVFSSADPGAARSRVRSSISRAGEAGFGSLQRREAQPYNAGSRLGVPQELPDRRRLARRLRGWGPYRGTRYATGRHVAHRLAWAAGLVASRTFRPSTRALGAVGGSGRATGPHLDRRLEVDGQRIDPMPPLTRAR